MASEEMLMVFCYDIVKNRTRQRVSKILEGVAVRVQKSIFEAWMSREKASSVAEELSTKLEASDSLRVYAIGANGYRRTKVYGAGVLSERQDFFLV